MEAWTWENFLRDDVSIKNTFLRELSVDDFAGFPWLSGHTHETPDGEESDDRIDDESEVGKGCPRSSYLDGRWHLSMKCLVDIASTTHDHTCDWMGGDRLCSWDGQRFRVLWERARGWGCICFSYYFWWVILFLMVIIHATRNIRKLTKETMQLQNHIKPLPMHLTSMPAAACFLQIHNNHPSIKMLVAQEPQDKNDMRGHFYFYKSRKIDLGRVNQKR